MKRQPWYATTTQETCARLDLDLASGLSADVVEARFAVAGPNQLRTASGPGVIRKFCGQFADVTVLVLIVAACIAVVMAVLDDTGASWVERYGDALAIFAIVLLNAIIGFVQEQRASKALAALGAMTSPSALARRGGEPVRVAASALVPGDVVLLAEGDRVPADLRLVQCDALTIDESVLTGESMVVTKAQADRGLPADTPLAERVNMAFSSTHVASGHGVGVVVATGMETEIGAIAGMLAAITIPDTPLRKELQRFGTVMVIACIAIAAVVFAVGFARQDMGIQALFLTAISLAVAAIPEGLPAITTIVLALGVQRMAKRNALVRRLSAVEALGSVQIICTDKTGTLTQNKMAVRHLATDAGELAVTGELALVEPEGALVDEAGGAPLDAGDTAAALIRACHHTPEATLIPREDGTMHVEGDATDGALELLARAFDPDPPPREVSSRPFDHTRMRATVLVEGGEAGALRSYTHGAPETCLERSSQILTSEGPRPLDAARRAQLLGVAGRWSDSGLRIIGVARRDGVSMDADTDEIESEMTFLGIVAIRDPPRLEVAPALALAQAAGVRTMMITGDHPTTARSIADELGLGVGLEVLTGAEIEALDDPALEARLDKVGVVARATAAHKLRIIEAFGRKGVVAAMTGDGVNDAPAIKAATIGVAMGKAGTDVTREAADIVLADDNYATIVAAIEEGRRIFENIKKFIIFLLAVNTGLVLAVFIAALLGWPPLLTSTQILWINLITNGMPALALGMETVHMDPMKKPPRDPRAGLLNLREAVWMGAYGAVMALMGLAVFALCFDGESDALRFAQTMTFTVLAIAPLFHALNTRSLDRSVFALGLLTNWRLLGAMAVALALQAIAIYTPGLGELFGTVPISLGALGVALGVSALMLPLGELEKLARRWMGVEV